MRPSSEQLETLDPNLAAARPLHPEDICVGDDVALYRVSYEWPSFLWCCADPSTLPPEQPVRITAYPGGEPQPMRVRAICLPFVVCRLANGDHSTFDIRQIQLARLDRQFAKFARRAIQSQNRKNRNKSRRKKKRK